MANIRIFEAESSNDVDAVKAIFLEYIDFIEDFLGQSLDFQNTDTEFADFPDMYDALLLATVNDQPVAACAIKPHKPGICELKRLYCRPAGRGHNLGERLTQAALSAARVRGYNHMYLDTDPGLTHANALYEKLGFHDIERYYENPMGCSRYMALAL